MKTIPFCAAYAEEKLLFWQLHCHEGVSEQLWASVSWPEMGWQLKGKAMADLQKLRNEEVPGTQKATSHQFKSPFLPPLWSKQSL